MWGFTPPPPQPAAKAPNVNRVPQPGGLLLACRICHAEVEWQTGSYGRADVWWFEMQHRHEPKPKGKR